MVARKVRPVSMPAASPEPEPAAEDTKDAKPVRVVGTGASQQRLYESQART
jgi:malic enzyme